MANTATIYGAEGKTDLLLFDPDKVVLVGLDKGWIKTDHPLYDKRVHLPIDEGMVTSLRRQGNIEPIGVWRDGGNVLCAVGRRRVKNAREANRRIRADGGEPIVLKATVVRAKSDADLFEIVIAENRIRENCDQMADAEDLLRLINMGRTEAQAGMAFGFSAGTVRNRLRLLDLHPDVQDAVRSGKVGATLAAQEFAEVGREEQPARLAQLAAAGTLNGHEAKENMRRMRDAKPATKAKARMQTRAIIEAARKRLKSADTNDALLARAVLKWALGEGCSADLPARVAEALEPGE